MNEKSMGLHTPSSSITRERWGSCPCHDQEHDTRERIRAALLHRHSRPGGWGLEAASPENVHSTFTAHRGLVVGIVHRTHQISQPKNILGIHENRVCHCCHCRFLSEILDCRVWDGHAHRKHGSIFLRQPSTLATQKSVLDRLGPVSPRVCSVISGGDPPGNVQGRRFS